MLEIRKQLRMVDGSGWRSQRVEVAGQVLSDDDVDLLIEIHSRYQSIRTLRLAMCRLSEEQRQRLARSLRQFGLSAVQFAHIGITETTAPALAAAIQESPQLKHLEIPFNDIGPKGAEWLANALRDSGLVSLILTKNNIGTGISSICRVIGTDQTSVRVLDIGRNDIRDEGAIHVAKMLEGKHSLTNLNVDFNQISPKGIEAICGAAGKCKSLLELSFSGNIIKSDACVRSIVAMLSWEDSRLEVLGMELLDMNNATLLSLAPGISKAPYLQKLKMKDNFRITDDAMYDFIEKIGFPPALEKIVLTHSGVSETCEKFVKVYLNALHSPKAKVMTTMMSAYRPDYGSKSLLNMLPAELIRAMGQFLALEEGKIRPKLINQPKESTPMNGSIPPGHASPPIPDYHHVEEEDPPPPTTVQIGERDGLLPMPSLENNLDSPAVQAT